MSPKILFLTGAPEFGSLEWDSTKLVEEFMAPVARFAGIPYSSDTMASFSVTPAKSRHASWRSLDLVRQPLRTGYSQIHGELDEYQGNAMFLAVSNSSCPSPGLEITGRSERNTSKETMSQYYEHSFAIHTDIGSSQIDERRSSQSISGLSFDYESTIDINEASVTTNEASFLSNSDSAPTPPRPPIPVGGELCALEDIPGAKYLESIQPQTATFNLIVGIISISTVREIKTRRGNNVGLVELLVGDETKSGFTINFWLPLNSKEDVEKGTGSGVDGILAGLRPQDIILLRNIAAAFFRGQVYGQSLRREMTKVHLLYRNRLDKSDIGGCYTMIHLMDGKDESLQAAKTRRVKEWVLHFVAPVILTDTGKGKRAVEEILPLDTQ